MKLAAWCSVDLGNIYTGADGICGLRNFSVHLCAPNRFLYEGPINLCHVAPVPVSLEGNSSFVSACNCVVFCRNDSEH